MKTYGLISAKQTNKTTIQYTLKLTSRTLLVFAK